MVPLFRLLTWTGLTTIALENDIDLHIDTILVWINPIIQAQICGMVPVQQWENFHDMWLWLPLAWFQSIFDLSSKVISVLLLSDKYC